MTQIRPFNPEDPDVQANVARIMMQAPVRNLTEAEVLATLRLLQLTVLLSNDYDRYTVCIHRNDKRLELCDDCDRFLALLIDCDGREVILGTKRCRSCFGGTVYHWRKIARKCPITDTASAVSDCSSGYYGRGWIIAPHIQTLRRWIICNSTNPEIRKLKNKSWNL